MADEIQAQENNQEASQAEPSSNEVEARASGWVPKEEYSGEANKWVDADEFVRRGPLFKKIDTQARELKEAKKAIEQLAQHHQKVRETEYKRALDDLKAAKKGAFIDGDADKIIEIDEQIDAVKDQQKQLVAEQTRKVTDTGTHPEFEVWKNRNTWYDQSKPMKAFADSLGIELAGRGLTPPEVLKEVEKQVKAEFPQKFTNPNRDKPGAVEGAGKVAVGANTGGYKPSAMEREIAQRFVRQGIFKTEADYYKELKDNS